MNIRQANFISEQISTKRFSLFFLASLIFLISGLYLFRVTYKGYATELTAICGSWVVALISLIPLFFWAWGLSSNKAFKMALILWIPIKFVLFLFVDPSFITFSADGIPIHNIYGLAVSNYWNNGGAFIPPLSFFYSISAAYPLLIYLIGGPYYIFGQYPLVVYPWQGLFQFMDAILVYFCFRGTISDNRLDRKVALAGFLYVIFSPLWLILTTTLLRDVLILLALFLTLLGLKKILFVKDYSGFILFIGGCFLTALIRAQYLLLYMLFIMVTPIYTRKQSRFNVPSICLLALLTGVFVYWENSILASGWQDIIHTLFLRNITIIGQTRGALLTSLFSPIKGLGAPVAFVFRIIGATVSPFPWYQENIVFASGGSIATLILHIIGSCFRIFLLGLFIYGIMRLRQTLSILTLWGQALSLFAVILLLATIFAVPNFVRYIAPFYILVIPFIGDKIIRKKVLIDGMIMAVGFAAMLHIVYEILHHVL